MNWILRISLVFALFTFTDSVFAIGACNDPNSSVFNQPFCVQERQFDQNNEQKLDILALSKAINDEITIRKNQTDSITGNVLANDWACAKRPCTQAVSAATVSSAFLVSSTQGTYGTLFFDNTGAYTYVLDTSSPKVQALKDGDIAVETFAYDMIEPWYAASFRGNLFIRILGDSGLLPASIQLIKNGIVARPDFGSVTKNGTLTFTGNSSLNDSGALTTVLLSSPASPYGNLAMNDSGFFTFTLFNDLPEVQSLGVGENIVVTFNYMIIGQLGFTSTSTITITILGNSASLTKEEQAIKDNIVARNDEGTVIKNNQLTFSGNTSDNDSGALTTFLVSDPTSSFGHIQLNSNGRFTYTLFNDTDAIKGLKEGEFLVDDFVYSIEGQHGYISTAKITIYILGNRTKLTPEKQAIKDSVVAVSDQVTVIQNVLFVASGNVTNNDSGALTAILKSSPNSKFGSVTFSSDGKFTYVLDNTAPAVLAIPPDSFVIDTFTYTIEGKDGFTDSAKLSVLILGKDAATVAQPPLSIVALDDTNIAVRETKETVSGNVGGNDFGAVNFIYTGHLVPSGDPAVEDTLVPTPIGEYGTFSLNSQNGDYGYSLFTDSSKLDTACDVGDPAATPPVPPVKFVIDRFAYSIQGTNGLTNPDHSSAIVTIYVICDPNVDPANVQNTINGLVALPDAFTLVKNSVLKVSGNVNVNDTGALTTELNTPPVGIYGVLELNSLGDFTFTLFNDLEAVQEIPFNESREQVYSYTIIGEGGFKKTTTITFRILGNATALVDNVEIEDNDRSTRATSLASTFTMKGHLLSSSDKDWYALEPAVNDKIIHIELCPQGSSCFGENSWVLYVFDKAKLQATLSPVPPAGELPADFTAPFSQEWVTHRLTLTRDDTLAVLSSSFSNHMYLNYRSGVFSGAAGPASLIGIIDLCFGDENTLDIGVQAAPREYLIAVSSTLLGDDNANNACGGGSVVLKKPGPTFDEIRIIDPGDPTATPPIPPTTKTVTVTTTQEFISAFPFSDDQYAFTITVRPDSPAARTVARSAVRSAAVVRPGDTTEFNPGVSTVTIPSVRILNELYTAELRLQPGTGQGKLGSYTLSLVNAKKLNGKILGDPLQASFNPANNQIHIPRLREVNSGKLFDVWLLFNPPEDGKELYFELLGVKGVQ